MSHVTVSGVWEGKERCRMQRFAGFGSLGLVDFSTSALWDFGTFELLDFQTLGPLDFGTFGLGICCWTFGRLDFWIVELSKFSKP